jgi:4-hydroxy-2-oxoheptanedioate aldolase
MTKLRTLWTEGKPTLNGWCMIGNPFVAEIMAGQGFDSVTVDMQHGALDYTDLLPMAAGDARLRGHPPCPRAVA